MGNTQENNNENLGKFNMQISLNRFNFFPGETIKGEIELSPKDENSIDFKLINNIKFYFALLHKECWKNNTVLSKDKAKEKISINIYNDSEIDNYKSDLITSKTEIYKNKNVFDKNQENNLIIPFQMKIPLDIKSSFEFFRHNKLSDIYAYSRIYLDIEIPDYLNKKEILIFIQSPPAPLNSELTISKYISKKKLGFIGSASNINFKGSYPKNYYGFNEICPLNISLDIFGSNENVNAIEFTLKRKITFLKNKSKIAEEYIDDLWQSNIKENVLKNNINFNLSLIESEKFIKEKKSKLFDINSVSKENLICLLPSYQGNLIKCNYYILIKIFYDSMLIKNPEFEMPLNLGHTKTIFNQTSMLDINKILGKINEVMIKSLIDDSNNEIVNNKKEIDMKSKMKDIFGENLQKNKERQENINKIFGNVPQKNINNNKKEETPLPQDYNNVNNNFSNNNLGSSNSSDLPSKDEIYTAKDEQPAPELTKKP